MKIEINNIMKITNLFMRQNTSSGPQLFIELESPLDIQGSRKKIMMIECDDLVYGPARLLTMDYKTYISAYEQQPVCCRSVNDSSIIEFIKENGVSVLGRNRSWIYPQYLDFCCRSNHEALSLQRFHEEMIKAESDISCTDNDIDQYLLQEGYDPGFLRPDMRKYIKYSERWKDEADLYCMKFRQQPVKKDPGPMLPKH